MRSYIGLALAPLLWGWPYSRPRAQALTAPAEPPTRIEADQAAHAIRFMVDGREEGRIDKDGPACPRGRGAWRGTDGRW